MRVLIVSLVISVVLSACNMTTERPAATGEIEPLNASALATTTPSDFGAGASQPANDSQQTNNTASAQQPNTTVGQQQPDTTVQHTNHTTTLQQSVTTSSVPDDCPWPQGWQTYYVRAGDTASRIAQAVGLSLDALVQANCLTDANVLTVGQRLMVPYTPASVPQTGGSNPPSLRLVGDFMGTPDLNSCWASNPGGRPVVYDAINGTPIAALSNRLLVTDAQGMDWIKVPLEGTKLIPESTGWMQTWSIRLIGDCTQIAGGVLNTYYGPQYGNPSGIPNDVCAVTPSVYLSSVRLYGQPDGTQSVGVMIGWAPWVSTQGAYHEVRLRGYSDGTTPSIEFTAWVSASETERKNC